MTLILDAGALLALERGDRRMWGRLSAAAARGAVPVTHGGVVGQVWRGGAGRQALLAKALKGIRVVSLDDGLGRRAGMILARSSLRDVVDAAVVAIAREGDTVVTSDPGDIAALAAVHPVALDVLVV